MASTIFGNGARIIKQVFDWMQFGEVIQTQNLIVDTFSAGINNATIAGEGFLIIPGNNNTALTPSINVTTGGIAYDPSSARIYITSSDIALYNAGNINTTTNDGLGNFILTPQSTGVVNVPLTQLSQNYLWINYLATIDTTAFTLNQLTNAKMFYKQTDGYNIQVTTVNVPPNANSIFLAVINLTGGGAVGLANISQVGRVYYRILPKVVPITTPLANLSDRTLFYNPASTYNLDAHIKAVGTGTGISPTNPHNTSLSDLGVSVFDTVNAHRQLEHGNAIIAGTVGDSYPTTSAMATSIAIVNPGSDYIIVRQLTSVQYIIVNGSAYNVTAVFGVIPVDANVTFPASSGTYNVYWDSVTKAFAVTTASIATDVTKFWLCTVTYTFVGLGPTDHNALSNLIERRRIGSTVEKYQRWATTARPPVPLPGEYGFNIDINAPEWFDGSGWQSLTVPTGCMLDFGGSIPPVGFLQCNGTAVSRTTYSNLFAVVGTTFGVGDGSTTFNIPDKRRRVAVGSGGTGTGVLGNTVGNVGGSETIILTTAQMPAHNHPASSSSSVSDPTHNHNNSGTGSPGTVGSGTATIAGAFGGNFLAAGLAAVMNPALTGISVSTSTTTSNTGGGSAHDNIQPSLVLTSIIKY